MDGVLDEFDESEVIAIKYHAWWPEPGNDPFYAFNPWENRNRINFYGDLSTPKVYVDGILEPSATSAFAIRNAINTRLAVSSPLQMTSVIGEAVARADTIPVTTTMVAVDSFPYPSGRFRLAVVEDQCYYVAPNGERWHRYVFRDMVPDAAGEWFQIAEGETLTFERLVPINPVYQEDSLIVVAFVQASTQEMVQAAIASSVVTSIGDKITPAGYTGAVTARGAYPNPFNPATRIEFGLAESGPVRVEIFDIQGRMVRTLTKKALPAGSHEVRWDGLDRHGRAVPSGVYLCRVSGSGETADLKLVLSR